MSKDMDKLINELHANAARHKANDKRTLAGFMAGSALTAALIAPFSLVVDIKEIDSFEWFFIAGGAAMFVYMGVMLAAHVDSWIAVKNMPPVPPTKPWDVNTGVRPVESGKVNIQHENGDIQWNVCAKDLDWSLSAANPIKTYLVKKQRV